MNKRKKYDYNSLWKDVTYHLKAKQLDKATGAKSFLEQRQRAEAKERTDKGLKWQTKVRENFILFIRNKLFFFFFSISILFHQANKNGLMIIN